MSLDLSNYKKYTSYRDNLINPVRLTTKRILSLCIFLYSSFLFSQSKQDYVWFLGDDHVSQIEGIQALKIDFNDADPQFVVHNNGLEFDNNNASICNKEGSLLFYTNGCAVVNTNHQIMLNGHVINEGEFLNEVWASDCSAGYPGRQDITIIPHPIQASIFYIVHKRIEYDTDQDPETFIDKLLFTEVDMRLDNGLGDVVQKNVVFYEGRIASSYLTTIAHSNRRDWWIIQPKNNGNCFLQFLLNDKGFQLPDSTCIGDEFHPNSSASGDAKFSPDGTMYAYYNPYDQLRIFDFDRSTGNLSNLRTLHVPTDTSNISFSSIEFSPNSRFLYFSLFDSLWQLDLHETILSEGLELIDTYDGFVDPFPTTFFLNILAPDCKIYIRSGSGSYSFHVIKKPNLKGKACNFQQNGIKLPLPTATGAFPNFPRFRVDEDEVCDSTITSVFGIPVVIKKELILFPNPADHLLTI